jgi:hypothetical protein
VILFGSRNSAEMYLDDLDRFLQSRIGQFWYQFRKISRFKGNKI